MHFGTIMKRARMARGLTLDDVARRVRSHKGYISGLENRIVNPPSAQLVIRLAKLYELDQTELLLAAVVEKAPREVRAELARRALGSSKDRTTSKGIARKARLAHGRIAAKARRLKLLAEEILDEVGGS